MCLKEFIIKLALITFCLWLLLDLFIPKYEFIDAKHRVNKITGKSEYYSDQSYNVGWHE